MIEWAAGVMVIMMQEVQTAFDMNKEEVNVILAGENFGRGKGTDA